MATMWTLIETCVMDADRAEALIHDLAAQRERRLDPETALAGFALWRGRKSRAVRTVDADGERGRLVRPARTAEAQDAA